MPGRHKRINGVDRLTILLLVYTSFCDSVKRGVWSSHGPGPVLEYAVRMHRFAPGALFGERLAADQLQSADVDQLAALLGDCAAAGGGGAAAAAGLPWLADSGGTRLAFIALGCSCIGGAVVAACFIRGTPAPGADLVNVTAPMKTPMKQ